MRWGSAIAGCALAVTCLRLVLVSVEVDGVVVPTGVRTALLTLAGLAAGVVITGGGAWLARAAVRAQRGRGVLVGAWLAVLGCSVVLVAPHLVLALDTSPLGQVLRSPGERWTWSVLAVLVVDLVAAAAFAAELFELPLQPRAGSSARPARRAGAGAGTARPAPRELPAEPSSAPTELLPCRYSCGRTFDRSAKERGHLRACPARGNA
ncbi:MAG TPA: hypothetical protein VF017_15445 [Thermoanaerobaculia bacterium]|nr:hypothetical protein [Thermoanaerobaculia bacterium]